MYNLKLVKFIQLEINTKICKLFNFSEPDDCLLNICNRCKIKFVIADGRWTRDVCMYVTGKEKSRNFERRAVCERKVHKGSCAWRRHWGCVLVFFYFDAHHILLYKSKWLSNWESTEIHVYYLVCFITVD